MGTCSFILFFFTRRWSSIRKEDPMNVVNRSLLRGHFQVTTIKPVPPGGLYGGLAMRCKINNNKQTKRK